MRCELQSIQVRIDDGPFLPTARAEARVSFGSRFDADERAPADTPRLMSRGRVSRPTERKRRLDV